MVETQALNKLKDNPEDFVEYPFSANNFLQETIIVLFY